MKVLPVVASEDGLLQRMDNSQRTVRHLQSIAGKHRFSRRIFDKNNKGEGMDRKFLMTGFGYAIVGLVLGIYMAATHNHGQLVAHAHILLLGFVVSFIYAVCYKLWLPDATGMIGTVQFWTHQLGTLGLVVGLYLLYGGYVSLDKIGPILGIFSVTALVGLLLMKVLLIKNKAATG